MAKQPYTQPFDRDMDFEADKVFTYLGKQYKVGEKFDNKLATTRRLRQLFEQHFIRYSGTATPGGQLPKDDEDTDQQALVKRLSSLPRERKFRRYGTKRKARKK